MTKPMLTDSGLETWLVFHRSIELPDFAAFPLLDHPAGRQLLVEYFHDHLHIAAAAGTGAVLETPTWRASPDWGDRLGYGAVELDRLNRDGVTLLRGLAQEHPEVAVVVSGNIGPRGDGYNPSDLVSAEVAEDYHRPQIESLAAAGADRVTMLTATHTAEPVGIVRAAVAVGIPVVIAFTVETDGRLPSGQRLHHAIAEVDEATDGAALTSVSTALILITSPTHSTLIQPSSAASSCYARTHHVRPTPSWTPPRSSTTAIRSSSRRSTRDFSARIRTSVSWAAAVAPTPGTSKRSPEPASPEPDVRQVSRLRSSSAEARQCRSSRSSPHEASAPGTSEQRAWPRPHNPATAAQVRCRNIGNEGRQ